MRDDDSANAYDRLDKLKAAESAFPMPSVVTLRAVETADLPVFFEHQLDPDATRMAAFPSREREPFMAHWAKVLANPACATRTILIGDQIAGNLGAWTDADSGERLVCYWIGREYWGQGIASAALKQFLECEAARPLYARVAKQNIASIRVLQKCGFVKIGEDHPAGSANHSVVEAILKLG